MTKPSPSSLRNKVAGSPWIIPMLMDGRSIVYCANHRTFIAVERRKPHEDYGAYWILGESRNCVRCLGCPWEKDYPEGVGSRELHVLTEGQLEHAYETLQHITNDRKPGTSHESFELDREHYRGWVKAGATMSQMDEKWRGEYHRTY